MSAPVSPIRPLRIAFIILGLMIFLWLSFEDRNESRAILLAGFLSLLIAIPIGGRIKGRMGVYLIPVLGAAFGLLVPVLAVLLMVVKIGLHDHQVPDFTFAQIYATLELIPVWVGVGILFGLGIALWRAIRAKSS